ncbi:NAD(+) diphosphatase [Celerinatantimonas yamalensis]|uniref:NAD-capped RNA hydrolase NudC n=1 Tax=Celerinatantimonas yamalensis TaxID=559956 RepID=A0ABW9GAH4_9GAMM
MSLPQVRHPNTESLPGWWFFTCHELLLCVHQGTRIPFGQFTEMPVSTYWLAQAEHFTDYRGEPCYRLELDKPIDLGVGEWLPLYALLSELDEALFMIAGQAMQQALFLATHRFCGRCAKPMQRIDWELAMHCNDCGFRAYPRISPSIIVAIRRGEQILLACHKSHLKRHISIYTAVAGFVEAGETLEQCVHREVGEEVGIRVNNLRYAGSQPWPFPHSMMVAFLADYQSGQLQIQRSELTDAQWFSLDALPTLPSVGTIARAIIDQLVDIIRAQTATTKRLKR